MQKTLGQLSEAVSALKEQTKDHGAKLESLGKDVHGAKVAGTVLVWVVGAAGTLIASAIGFLGFVVKAYLGALK
jgi:NAD/NADP transhydrogenase alpha subunit